MVVSSAYSRGDYDWLYANYLSVKHGRLSRTVIEHCERDKPELALDLCAGTGHLTLVLVGMGIPHIVAVDASPAMLDQLRKKVDVPDDWVSVLCMNLDSERALRYLKRNLPHPPDLITCRQGVGYLSPVTLSLIPRLLLPGGTFIFNSFIEPPRRKFWRHRREGGIYEAGFYAFHHVFHVQFRWPRLDFTKFVWHDVERLHAPLWRKNGFGVDIQRRNRTLIVKVHKP